MKIPAKPHFEDSRKAPFFDSHAPATKWKDIGYRFREPSSTVLLTT